MDGIADQTRMKTENSVSLRKQLRHWFVFAAFYHSCSELGPVFTAKAQSEYELLLQCMALPPEDADFRSSHVVTNESDIILTTFQGSSLELWARRT